MRRADTLQMGACGQHQPTTATIGVRRHTNRPAPGVFVGGGRGIRHRAIGTWRFGYGHTIQSE